MPTYSDPDRDPVAWHARMGEPGSIDWDDQRQEPYCECTDPVCPCGGMCDGPATVRLYPHLASRSVILELGERLCTTCADFTLDTGRGTRASTPLDPSRIIGGPEVALP